jgi:hypothetical protein
VVFNEVSRAEKGNNGQGNDLFDMQQTFFLTHRICCGSCDDDAVTVPF